jgi:hypothetical protein
VFNCALIGPATPIAQFGVINGQFYMFLRLCSSKVLLFPDGQTYWPSKE